jgi:hypothetical protein
MISEVLEGLSAKHKDTEFFCMEIFPWFPWQKNKVIAKSAKNEKNCVSAALRSFSQSSNVI